MDVASAIETVSDASFRERVLRSPAPVVVEYTATWCSPCRQMAPVLEEVARAYGDRVRFVRVDTDDSPNTAQDQDVRGVPTLQMFHRGKVTKRSQGARTKQELVTMVDDLIELAG